MARKTIVTPMKAFLTTSELQSFLDAAQVFQQDCGQANVLFSPTKFTECPLHTLLKGRPHTYIKGQGQPFWMGLKKRFSQPRQGFNFAPFAIIGTCLHHMHENDITEENPRAQLHFWARKELSRHNQSIQELFAHRHLLFRISGYQSHFREWYRRRNLPQNSTNPSPPHNPTHLSTGPNRHLQGIYKNMHLDGHVDKMTISAQQNHTLIHIIDIKTGPVGKNHQGPNKDEFHYKQEYIIQLIWYGFLANQIAIQENCPQPTILLSLENPLSHFLSKKVNKAPFECTSTKDQQRNHFKSSDIQSFFQKQIAKTLDIISGYLDNPSQYTMVQLTLPGKSCQFCPVRGLCQPYHDFMDQHRQTLLPYAVSQDIWGSIVTHKIHAHSQEITIINQGIRYLISKIPKNIPLAMGNQVWAYRLENEYNIKQHVYPVLHFVEGKSSLDGTQGDDEVI